jgi:hypothetical protein
MENLIPINQLVEKWKPVLEHEQYTPIKDEARRKVTAVVLENTSKALAEEGRVNNLITENAPTNNMGGGQVATFDPVLISLIRRAMPKLIAYDVVGVQPMTGPTGLIFAMRSRYNNMVGTEALHNEANTGWSGKTGPVGVANTDPTYNLSSNAHYTVGTLFSTAEAEGLGTSGNSAFAEMAFSIEKVTVTAESRALKAEYSMELAQDLKAIHGLDAEGELSNILSAELLTEINREVIRKIYRSATVGAAWGTTTAGVFDLDTDANGRWSVEKFKGLVFQIEREANAIARTTRRGKGNIMIVSADVASALAMAGVLSYTPALQASVNLEIDETGNTFAGTMAGGRVKVFIDPYFGGASVGNELVTIGYKGSNIYDAGIFYCPYVPLQMVRAVDPGSFQPKIGFKTRYGMVANPFATTAANGVVGNRGNASETNIYYRIFKVTNLL